MAAVTKEEQRGYYVFYVGVLDHNRDGNRTFLDGSTAINLLRDWEQYSDYNGVQMCSVVTKNTIDDTYCDYIFRSLCQVSNGSC